MAADKNLKKLILLLQAGNGGALVNGVPVIDVSALEQAADSSNESSATTEPQGDSHDTDSINQTSPQFITVTGICPVCFTTDFCCFLN